MKDHLEIERKFLVNPLKLPEMGDGDSILQAYLSLSPVVRVRLRDDRGYMTVKGPGLRSRREVDMTIEADAARALFELKMKGSRLIAKTRYTLAHAGKIWEVDVFENELTGLVIGEIELSSEEEEFDAPPWLDREVTDEPDFQNVNIALNGMPKTVR